MPCNDQPSLCGEGSTTCTSNNNNDILEAHHIAPSSSSTINGNITEQIIEERRVNISASAENGTSQHVQSVQPEQKTTNSSRSRIMSLRSINLQTIALPGEELHSSPDSENCITMESCHLFLTQYRLIIISRNQNAMCAIPLTGVDLLEAKDIVVLQISCKDGRIIKFRAENSEIACTWYKKLMQKTCAARDLSNIFAFKFYAESMKAKQPPNWLPREMKKGSAREQLEQEFLRFKLNENNWKISHVNENFDICLTYPQHLIVPFSINDEELKQMSFGRCHHRFPTLVWRNRRNGAVLLRSSQPSIGFFGMSMSNDKDVTLYEKIRAAISTDPNYKILIVDARSYTAAWANRAKGGGFETADTYTNAEVIFMGLPNIHNIRYSFHQLRQLLNASNDSTYLQMLQSTLWLHNIVQLFTATERCLNALCEGTSVLVHCSDGWDRTTQIVSLCMLIADPFYRTFDGFEMLIQRQWVEFGHKFGDRGGVLNSDENEKSPVFLQFLDCVFQLWSKNSHLFEFNQRYLMKLMQHTTSGLFGTFLFNSIKDAIKMGYDPYDADDQKQKCYQIWSYLGKHNAEFHNPIYNGGNKLMLDYPKSVPEVLVWRAAYCCTAEQSMINNPDDSMHQSNGTGSTQDITCDKASSTLSRSQSAASLTSLHELNQSNYSTNNCSTFQLSNGTTTTSGMGNCSIGSIYSTTNCQGQPKLDVDGLSLLPLQPEDHMRRKYELERTQQQISKLTASTQNIAIKGDAMNTTTNGKLPNGIIPTTTEGGMGISITRRTRNESVDSSTYEKVLPDVGVGDFRLKHNSSSSLTSVQPSSFSSCGEIMMMPSSINNGICCKNGTLQEGVETETMNGDEDGLEMLHSQ